MNIGVDIRPLMDSNRTGVGEYIYELLNALFHIDRVNQYFLFYNSNKDVSKNIPKWTQENIHYIKSNWPNKLFNLCLLVFNRPKIDKIINQNLDYFFSPNINFTALSRHGRGKVKKVKHILTIHDLSFEYFPDCFGWKRRLWHKILFPKYACKKADIILTPSESTRQDVMEKYKIDGNKVKVIYPGLSSIFMPPFAKATAGLLSHIESSAEICGNEINESIKKKYNLPKKFILFLGTIEPRKNIIGIIKAFIKNQNFFPDYKLVIAGAKGWEYKPIMDMIQKQNKVQYVGYVEAKDKPILYSLADLFVYSSLYEGFGFPVLEAMSVGTPVIASHRSSMPEVTEGSAYLVNPNIISEIAEGIKLLLTDQKAAEFLKAKGRERARNFTWEKAAREFLDVLK